MDPLGNSSRIDENSEILIDLLKKRGIRCIGEDSAGYSSRIDENSEI